MPRHDGGCGSNDRADLWQVPSSLSGHKTTPVVSRPLRSGCDDQGLLPIGLAQMAPTSTPVMPSSFSCSGPIDLHFASEEPFPLMRQQQLPQQ